MQDADTLTVERELYVPSDLQPKLKLRYALDGSAGTNTLMLGRGMQKLVSTTAWEGDKLVVKTRNGVEVTRTLWLEYSGNPARAPTLVIETDRNGAKTRTVHARR